MLWKCVDEALALLQHCIHEVQYSRWHADDIRVVKLIRRYVLLAEQLVYQREIFFFGEILSQIMSFELVSSLISSCILSEFAVLSFLLLFRVDLSNILFLLFFSTSSLKIHLTVNITNVLLKRRKLN